MSVEAKFVSVQLSVEEGDVFLKAWAASCSGLIDTLNTGQRRVVVDLRGCAIPRRTV
jgi:hypothetical protein